MLLGAVVPGDGPPSTTLLRGAAGAAVLPGGRWRQLGTRGRADRQTSREGLKTEATRGEQNN